jgi:uncharacterized membrane protein YfcA
MGNFFSILPGPLGSQDPYLLAILMGVVFAGAFLTSAFGIGGGVFMTPLFILLLPPKLGIGLLGPLMLLSSGTGVRQYWKEWDHRIVMVLLPSSLVGVWLGTYLLSEISPVIVKKTVGILAIFFGAIQFITVDQPEWRNRLQPATWQGVVLGFASGITSALAHIGGIVFSFYLLPHSRTKEIFVGTTVFLFFAQGLLKMGTYVYYHILTLPILILSLTLIPTLLLGSMTGKRLNRLIPHKLFMRLICILVAAMGIGLIFG